MEPSPYSERFTVACNHSREPAGGGSGCRAFRGSAGNQLGFPLYSPTLRCRTNIIMAKVPGASIWGGVRPGTTLTRVIVRLKPSDSLRRCRATHRGLTIYHHWLSIPIPLLNLPITSLTSLCIVLERFALPGCSMALQVPLP